MDRVHVCACSLSLSLLLEVFKKTPKRLAGDVLALDVKVMHKVGLDDLEGQL